VATRNWQRNWKPRAIAGWKKRASDYVCTNKQ
jgi:hypothetical protein